MAAEDSEEEALRSVALQNAQQILQARRRAEDALRKQTEWLRVTLASIGDAVISTDAKGNVNFMNGVAESLTGWTHADAAGRSLPDVFRIVNEESRSPVANPAVRALEHGVIVGLANHTVLIAKDGTERPIDDSAAPIRGASGEVVGCVLVFRDVAERRRAEQAQLESERRFRVMADAAPVLIWISGTDKACTWFNTTWVEFVGRPMEREIGNGWTENVHPDDFGRCIQTYATAFDQRQPFSMEYRLRRHDGEYRWMLDNGRPRFGSEGEFAGYIGSCIDVTGHKVAEEKLVRLAEELRLVADAVPALISYVDSEGRYRFNNKAYEDWFGRRSADMQGKHLSEVLGEAAFERVRPHFDAALAGKRLTFEDEVPYQEGGTRYIRAEYVPDIKPDGAVAGYYALINDITDRKKIEKDLRASELRLRFILDSMPQKVFTAKPGGEVDYFNLQWTEFTGLPFEQIRDWGWTKFVHPDDVAENVRVWQRSIETGEPFEFEQRFRRADGAYCWHLSRAVSLKDSAGAVVMWVGSNTDIDDDKRTANQLRQLASDLSEADRRKNEFLAMLAHELRNPLAPISNALHVMRLTGGNREAVDSATTMMQRQIGHLSRLVDDLLDVSRITRGKIELRKERIDLASVVQHALEAVRPLAEGMGHELTVTLPPEPLHVDGDPLRLAQALGNLLNNACKYTKQAGRIGVAVERDEATAVIRVRDNGIGIAADQLPQIFEMFTQLDTSLERSHSGLGIGLTLVKELVQMHGGEVEGRSAGPGHGSEFTIRLPLMTQTSHDGPPKQAGEHPTPTIARRILIVDDNVDAATSLAMLMQLASNETHTVFDGLEAVQAAAEFRPDVVLLDIGMPRMNGYETARRIREQPWAGT